MPPKDEKHTDLPLLEPFDATNSDSQPELTSPPSLPTKPTPPPTKKRRALGVLILVIWTVSVYLVSFNLFRTITPYTLDVLQSTASKAYTAITEVYLTMTNPATKEEVVELVTELYELLAEMGYYDAGIIERAPHEKGINTTLAAELEFSPQAIEMMEMLPYLRTKDALGWGGDDEILLGGRFADLREDGVLRLTRDPMFIIEYDEGVPKGFDEDMGKYMRPDYVCLSLPGEGYGAIMILDVRTMKLWTYDFEKSGRQADPALRGVDGVEISGNWLAPENVASRLARDALRDYITRLKTLEWMPGGIFSDSWDGDEYARLYTENGWPESFNSTAFNTAREKWHEDDEARSEAEAPFRKVHHADFLIQVALDDIGRKRKMIGDVDADMSIPANKLDRDSYKEGLQDEVKKRIESLPELHEKLEAAREVAKGVDPEVKKAREQRVWRYGH